MDVVRSAANADQTTVNANQLKLTIRYVNNAPVSVGSVFQQQQQQHHSARADIFNHVSEQQQQHQQSAAHASLSPSTKKPRGRPRKDSASDAGSRLHEADKPINNNNNHSEVNLSQMHPFPFSAPVNVARESQQVLHKQFIGEDRFFSSTANMFPAHNNLRSNVSLAFGGTSAVTGAATNVSSVSLLKSHAAANVAVSNSARNADGRHKTPPSKHDRSLKPLTATSAAPGERVVPATPLGNERITVSSNRQHATSATADRPLLSVPKVDLLSHRQNLASVTEQRGKLTMDASESEVSLRSKSISVSTPFSAAGTGTTQLDLSSLVKDAWSNVENQSITVNNSAIVSNVLSSTIDAAHSSCRSMLAAPGYHASSSASLTSATTPTSLRSNQFCDFLYPEVSLPAAAAATTAATTTRATTLLGEPPSVQFAPFSSVPANQPFTNNSYYNDLRPGAASMAASRPFAAPQQSNIFRIPPSLAESVASGLASAAPNSSGASSSTLLASYFTSLQPQQQSQQLPQQGLYVTPVERLPSEEEQIRKLLLYRRLKNRVICLPELEQSVDVITPLLEQMQLIEPPVVAITATTKSKKLPSTAHQNRTTTPSVVDEAHSHPHALKFTGGKSRQDHSETQPLAVPDENTTSSADNVSQVVNDAAFVSELGATSNRDIGSLPASKLVVTTATSAAGNTTISNNNTNESSKFAFLPLKKRLYRATVVEHDALTGVPTTLQQSSGYSSAVVDGAVKSSINVATAVENADEDATSTVTSSTTNTTAAQQQQHIDSVIESVLRNVGSGTELADLADGDKVLPISGTDAAGTFNEIVSSDITTPAKKTRGRKPKQLTTLASAIIAPPAAHVVTETTVSVSGGEGEVKSSFTSSEPRIVLKIKKLTKPVPVDPAADTDNELVIVKNFKQQQQKAKFFKSKASVSHQASVESSGQNATGAHDAVSTARNAPAAEAALRSTNNMMAEQARRDSTAAGETNRFVGCEVIFAEPTILSTTPPVMAADALSSVLPPVSATPTAASSASRKKPVTNKMLNKKAADAASLNLPAKEVLKIESDAIQPAVTPTTILTKKRGPSTKLSSAVKISIDAAAAVVPACKSTSVIDSNDKDATNALLTPVGAKKRGRPSTKDVSKIKLVEKPQTLPENNPNVDNSNEAINAGSVSAGAVNGKPKRNTSKRKTDALDDAVRTVQPKPAVVDNSAAPVARKPARPSAGQQKTATAALVPEQPLRFFSMLPMESSDAPYHPAGLIIPNGVLGTVKIGGSSDDMDTEAGDHRMSNDAGRAGSKKRRTAERKRAQQQQIVDTFEHEQQQQHRSSEADKQQCLVKPLTVKIPKLIIKTPVKPTAAMEAEVTASKKSEPLPPASAVNAAVITPTVNKRSASTAAVGMSKRVRIVGPPAASAVNVPQKELPSLTPVKVIKPVAGGVVVAQQKRRNSFVNSCLFTDRLTYVEESLMPKKIDAPACQCQPPAVDTYAEAGCDEFCTNRMVFTECSPATCPCGERCSNQRIRSGIFAVRKSRLEMFDASSGATIGIVGSNENDKRLTPHSSAGCNTGVRWPASLSLGSAAETIPALDVICEYAGHIMTSTMFNERLRIGQYRYAKRQFAIELPDYGKTGGFSSTSSSSSSWKKSTGGSSVVARNQNNSIWPQRIATPKIGSSSSGSTKVSRKPTRVLLPFSSNNVNKKLLPAKSSLIISTYESGNESRFIRHSCLPTAKLEVWLVDNEARVVVCARNKIVAGTEITLDYGDLAHAYQWLCTCKTRACRRLIGSQAAAAAIAVASVPRPLHAGLSSSSNGAAVEPQLLPWSWWRRRDHITLLAQLFPVPDTKDYTDLCCKNISTSRILQKHSKQIQRGIALQQHRSAVGGAESSSVANSSRRSNYGGTLLMAPSLLKDVLEKQIRPLALAAEPVIRELTGASAAHDSMSLAHTPAAESPSLLDNDENVMTVEQLKPRAWEPGPASDYPEEEVIRCPCNWYVDVDDMVQCDTCQVWQHISCLALPKEQVSRDDFIYKCERCSESARLLPVEREIPQRDEKTLEPLKRYDKRENCSFTYYLTLVADNCQDMQVRMNDYVYLTPRRDKPAHGTKFDVLDLDIMEVECLWKASSLEPTTTTSVVEAGRKMAGGRRYYRPVDLHVREGTKFFPNELVRGAIDETVTLDCIVGRCCVMDLETYQLGRPKEYPQEHIYIAEYECDERRKALTKFSSLSKRKAAGAATAAAAIKPPLPSANTATPAVDGIDNNDDAAAMLALNSATSNQQQKEKGQPLRKINTNNYYFQRYGEKLVPRKQPLSLRAKAKRRQYSGAGGMDNSAGGAAGIRHITSADGSSAVVSLANIPSIRDVVVAKCVRLEKLRQKLYRRKHNNNNNAKEQDKNRANVKSDTRASKT